MVETLVFVFVYVGEQGQRQRLYVNGEEICIDEGVDSAFVALPQTIPNSPPPTLTTYLNHILWVQWLREQIKNGLLFGFS
ncbi:MAG: hypothetical protein IPI79_15240 [Moraxellaceae bacterium]|nr:hypothetical protein [Moraxellaceae bacterium]